MTVEQAKREADKVIRAFERGALVSMTETVNVIVRRTGWTVEQAAEYFDHGTLNGR